MRCSQAESQQVDVAGLIDVTVSIGGTGDNRCLGGVPGLRKGYGGARSVSWLLGVVSVEDCRGGTVRLHCTRAGVTRPHLFKLLMGKGNLTARVSLQRADSSREAFHSGRSNLLVDGSTLNSQTPQGWRTRPIECPAAPALWEQLSLIHI